MTFYDGASQNGNKVYSIGPGTLLLLLFSSLHWRLYHQHWRANILTHQADYGSQFAEHLFIYQSFLYSKGNKAFSHHPNGSAAPATLATLFVANREQNFSNSFLYCIYRRGRRGLVSDSESFPLHYTSAPTRQALIFPLHPNPCRLIIFVALCDFLDGELPEIGKEDEEEFSKIGEFALEFRSTPRGGAQVEENEIPGATLLTKQISSQTTVTPLATVTQADTTPRQLVLCMSRMMAFENWRLVVTALEVYRRLGVDLVVTHVLSAVSPLFALMRHYESAGTGSGGLLRVKPAVMFPMLRLGAGPQGVYDPNIDTEWTSLLMSGNECLYEYRASAAFIAFLDWDDMLVSGGNIFTCGRGGKATACEALPPSKTLPEAFHSALERHSSAAYFVVNRLEAASPAMLKGEDPLDFDSTLEGFRTSLGLLYGGKMVVVPSRLHGVWIHESVNFIRAEHIRVELPAEDALIVHIDGRVGDPNNAGLHGFNLTSWLRWKRFNETDLSHVWHQHEYLEIMANLRKSIPSYNEKFNRCSVQFARYFQLLEAEKRGPVCLGFHMCGILPQPGVKCVNAKNYYRRHHTGLKNSLPVAHVRYASQLVESDQGCVVV